MGIEINLKSLSKTVDSVNESTFFSLKPSAKVRADVARWIAVRQGLPGCYGDMFAGFESERDGIQLFTGERITSASARHILGEETCRALRLLNVRDKTVREALARADAGMMKCLSASQRDRPTVGWFCCGKCSVGLWRNLLSGGLDRREERLASGVSVLNAHRNRAGGWRRFPFWYVVLALIEIDSKAAKEELKHVSRQLERAANLSARKDAFSIRRRAIAGRALERL